MNGRFKGVEYGAVYPNWIVMYGQIRVSESLLINSTLLDVMEIRCILAGEDEKFSSHLVPVQTFHFGDASPLVL